jgi:hypothetical protein
MTLPALVALVGAFGSVGFLWRAGQSTPTMVLALMTLWVIAPFLGLIVAGWLSTRWYTSARAALRAITVVTALGSLVIYGTPGLKPHDRPAAFMFVLVPMASWFIAGAAVAIGSMVGYSRRSKRP